MAKVAGTVYVRVDGTQLKTKGTVEFPLSDKKREVVMAHGGPAGYSEEDVEPFLNCTVIVGPDFPLSAVVNGTDITAVAEAANGLVYTLSGAFLKDQPTLKSESGEAELKWGGMRGEFQ